MVTFLSYYFSCNGLDIFGKKNLRVLYVAKLAMNSQKSSNVSLLSAMIIGMYHLTQLDRNLKLPSV